MNGPARLTAWASPWLGMVRCLCVITHSCIFSVKKAFPFGCLVWNASHPAALFLIRFGNDLFPLGTTVLPCQRAVNATDNGLNWKGGLAIIWVLPSAHRACQPHLCVSLRSRVSGAINDLDSTNLGPTLKHVSDVT